MNRYVALLLAVLLWVALNLCTVLWIAWAFEGRNVKSFMAMATAVPWTLLCHDVYWKLRRRTP